MSPKPKNNLSRPAKPTVASFKTSKGSEYTVDGASTVRNKSYHAEHGAADTGVKPKSSRTVYIGADAQSDVAYAVGQLDRGASVKMEGDELVVRYNYGRADKPRQMEKRFPVGHTPEKGMAPVEFWDDKKSVHVGNEITEIITHSPPAGPTSMAKTPKKPSNVTQEEWDFLEEVLFGVPKKEFVDPTDPGLLAAMNSPASSATNSGLTRLEKKALSKKARLVRQTEDLAARDRERTLIKHAIESVNNKEMDPVLAKMLDTEIRTAKTAGTVGSSGSLTAARIASKGSSAASVAADVASGTISAGALAGMTDKGGTISAGALASMANKGTVSKGALAGLAKATGKSVGFLTKAAGVLGWAGLAYTLYENTIGRRNDARQQEATALADVGMNGLAQAPQYGEEAYGRLLPGLASGSEAVASASDRTEFNNAVSLDSLLRQNQGALQQAAQVTPVSFEEFMLRVKAEMAARGG